MPPTDANSTLRPCVRALHVFASLNRGGAETWLMDVVRNSDRARLAIDVCLIGGNEGAYEAEFRALGGRVFRCPLRQNVLQFGRSFRRLLQQEHFDVVHSHVYLFSGLILRAAAKAAVPQRVAHIHPIEDVKAKRTFRSLYHLWMRRWLVRYGTHFVSPTRDGLDQFWGADWTTDPRKQVIYNGIQVQRFVEPVDRATVRAELQLPRNAKIALNVARFAPHKRHAFLVEVAADLAQRRHDIFFLLIGAGDLQAATQELVARRQLDATFRFLQGAANIDRYWLAADAFAFPSCNEGFGIVIAEAAAAGLPVVAQDIPGVREAAKACHSVSLLPLDTPPSVWSKHLELAVDRGILTDPVRRQRLADFPFTIERSVAALMRLYNLHAPR